MSQLKEDQIKSALAQFEEFVPSGTVKAQKYTPSNYFSQGYDLLSSAVTSAASSQLGSEQARDNMSSASSEIHAAQAGFYLSNGLIGTLDMADESSNLGEYFNMQGESNLPVSDVYDYTTQVSAAEGASG